MLNFFTRNFLKSPNIFFAWFSCAGTNNKKEKMSYHLIPELKSKADIDAAIMKTVDKVLVLRFGKADDMVCMQLDQIVCNIN